MMNTRHHAHALIDSLPEVQLTALVGFLESIVKSQGTTLANAPFDDEPETEEERVSVADARASIQQNGGKGIPHAEAMHRLGLE